VQQLARVSDRKIETLMADLSMKSDLARVEDRLRSDEAITALVNNAGIGSMAPLVRSDPDQMETMIQVNVTALTRLTIAAIRGFVKRKNGIIINIASAAALAPELLNGSYSATKAYVMAFTLSLHYENGTQGVQVQAVLPGATRTEFWDRIGSAASNLPPEIVMSAEEMVDAAMVGLDQKELITIPSLPDPCDWDDYVAARARLKPNLSHHHAAARYRDSLPVRRHVN
jgi:short-subunit dehydrogenase